jgi:thiamine biosynthesis lipoprotein
MSPLKTRPRLGTVTFGAWSCTVRLVLGNERSLELATTDLVNLLARVDAAASRFQTDSELTRANSLAGRPVPVSRLLTDLVGAALDAAARTDGAVDPTVGRAMTANGYDRDIADVLAGPDRGERLVGERAVPAAARRSWVDVRLDRSMGLLTVPVGCALDLGATAKAFVADLAARKLSARYDCPVLVELGGDLAVAGTLTGGWPIRVAEAQGAAASQSVTITRGGVATSTTTVRRWLRGDTTMHHIVDPVTGAPAHGPWRTASVWADSAFAANTASTAAIVLGARAVGWLQANGIAARLVDHSGAITTTGDWPTAVTPMVRAA